MANAALDRKWFSGHPEHAPDVAFLDRLLKSAKSTGWSVLSASKVKEQYDRTGDVALGRGGRILRVSVLPRSGGGSGRLKILTEVGNAADIEEFGGGWRFRLGGVVVGTLDDEPARVLELLGSDE